MERFTAGAFRNVRAGAVAHASNREMVCLFLQRFVTGKACLHPISFDFVVAAHRRESGARETQILAEA